jgi:hypothetical protein
MMQDDGESYANDTTDDFYYEFPVDRLRSMLRQQLSNVVGVYFDPDEVAGSIATALGPAPVSGIVRVSKDNLHQRLQQILDYLPSDRISARVANESLTLFEQLTLIHRGTV